MSVYDSTNYDYIYLYNSGKENVPIYAGNENAINPKPNTVGIVMRFKTTMDTYLMGRLPMEKCVKIKMTQDSLGFMEFVDIDEFYKAFKKKIHVTYSNKSHQGKSHTIIIL